MVRKASKDMREGRGGGAGCPPMRKYHAAATRIEVYGGNSMVSEAAWNQVALALLKRYGYGRRRRHGPLCWNRARWHVRQRRHASGRVVSQRMVPHCLELCGDALVAEEKSSVEQEELPQDHDASMKGRDATVCHRDAGTEHTDCGAQASRCLSALSHKTVEHQSHTWEAAMPPSHSWPGSVASRGAAADSRPVPSPRVASSWPPASAFSSGSVPRPRLSRQCAVGGLASWSAG